MADKYDIAIVRGHCCQFLATHVAEMDLAQPLESPRNVLRAASLAHAYGSSKAQDMVSYSDTCLKAVDGVLAGLVGRASGCTSCGRHTIYVTVQQCTCGGAYRPSTFFHLPNKAGVDQLLALVKDPRYPTLVVHEVQVGTVAM